MREIINSKLINIFILVIIIAGLMLSGVSCAKKPGPGSNKECGHGSVWVPGHHGPYGKWIPGHCVPKECGHGSVWVPGHHGPYGKWIPGHCVPK